MKKILITGVTGQDGSFMADYLLENTDHMIVAGLRRLSVPNYKNIEHLYFLYRSIEVYVHT